MLLTPTFDDHGILATVPLGPGATQSEEAAKPELTTEQGMIHAVKMGALVGIPGTIVMAGGIGLLGGATPLISLGIGVFCSLWSGVYLGGIFFLPRNEEHFVRPPEWETVGSLNAKRAAVAAAAGTVQSLE